MMKRRMVLGLMGGALAAGAFGSTAFAHGRWGGWHGRRHGPFRELLRDLDLTDEQKRQLAQLVKSRRSDIETATDGVMAAWQKLVGLAGENPALPGDRDAALAGLADAEQVAGTLAFELHAGALQVLTPEQRARVGEAARRATERIGERRQARAERMEHLDEHLDEWLGS